MGAQMKAIVIVLGAAMAACQATASSTTPQIRAVSAENVQFRHYRTFGFRLADRPPSPYEVSARSFEVERRLYQLVASELAQKGYKEAGSRADFLVRLSSGSNHVGRPAEPGADGRAPRAITMGEVVVDAFDASTAQQVWHATAEAEIGADGINDGVLQSSVRRMLASFPARSTGESEGATALQPAD
jgi:Domain of unknown function (DUF4136)